MREGRRRIAQLTGCVRTQPARHVARKECDRRPHAEERPLPRQPERQRIVLCEGNALVAASAVLGRSGPNQALGRPEEFVPECRPERPRDDGGRGARERGVQDDVRFVIEVLAAAIGENRLLVPAQSVQ